MFKCVRLSSVCPLVIGAGILASGCSGGDDLKAEKPDPTLDSLPPAPNEGPPGGGGDTAPPGPKKGGT